MASLEELRAERLKKAELLRERGLDPYPSESNAKQTLAEVLEAFTKHHDAHKTITVAGRLRAIREQGALAFLDLDDGTGRLQILVKREALGADSFDLLIQTLDVGDWLEFAGSLMLTKRQEKTVAAGSWRMLAKSLRPLPDKWHGLQAVEERFRHRYLDSLTSPEVGARFRLRSRLISLIRSFLDHRGFLEVETPMLQPLAGGATAEPFMTHHQALGLDLYLRISEELYLKRWLIGGFPRVYSLAKNFRNEGIDVNHNPEFTMLEWYQAFSNAAEQKKQVEQLFRDLTKKLLGKTLLTYQGAEIDLGAKFKSLTYYELLQRQALITHPETATDEELLIKAKQLGVEVPPQTPRVKMLDLIYKKVCRPKLIQPTFITDYPVDYLPLAKRRSDNPNLVEAFQLVVGGLELVKAFSELNDPIDQRARFTKEDEARLAGDKEAQTTDEDFLEALEYGLPPAGGVGIGIDRLLMLLTDCANIREVIFFPLLRPK